jgi:soluble lytic murein transglycosylase-like protein
MGLPKFKEDTFKKSFSRRDWLMILLGGIIVLVIGGILRVIHDAQTPLRPESEAITSPWIPATVKKWDKPINEMAKKYKVDPNLIAIIITLESGGDPKAHSEADAKGLMQITPPTGKDIAAKFVKKPVSKYDLFDPNTNIEFGTAYLAWLRDEFGEPSQGPDWNSTVELIAAGYNGGPGAANSVEQGKGLKDIQTVIYSRDAFNMWRERFAKASPTFDRWKERGGIDLINKAKEEK